MDVEKGPKEKEFEEDEDSCSNNSNSPEAMSEDEEVDDKKITEIQEQIKSNPYVYEPHVQLITLLRKAGDLDKLREARDEMSKIFPLTPELWLDWLTDEEKLAVTDAEKETLIALFERSVKDYSSVSVWLEYAQYSIGNMGMDDAIENVRKIFERALTAVGIHVTQGALIWEAYREFEFAMLSTMQATNGDETVKQEQEKEQKTRIFNLFRRQLSVPLLYMDKTYKEFQEYCDGKIDYSIEKSYQKASRKMERLKSYEDLLFESEAPHLKEYKKYIEFEILEGDPVRVQNIFERSLVENCLVPDLWQDFTKYLDRKVKIDIITLSAHERAVRNCPWCAACWKNFVVALERHNQSHDTIKEAFEKALQAGFTNGEDYYEIWLAYLDYLRRRMKTGEQDSELKDLRTVFERAAEHVMTYFRDSDPQCSILQYWAKIEAKYFKNISQARKLWNDIMNHGHNAEADMWLNYANFERSYGDKKHFRRVLFKGLYAASDWPETIGNALLIFEREEGTLETLDIATEKYESQMQRVQEKRQRIAAKEAERQNQDVEHKKQIKAERKAAKLAALRGQHYQLSKTSKLDSATEGKVKMDSEGFKIPPPPPRMQLSPEVRDDHSRVLPSPSLKHKREEDTESQPEPKKQKSSEQEEEVHGMTIKHDPLKDDRTVFLSNLLYSVEEEKIKDLFSGVGDVAEIRLVKDYKGRSKGYCYVVFSTRDEAEKALKKDREPIDGRPVFVSRCEDRKSKPTPQEKFKFGRGLEKNKLFVKGLPYSTTKEDLIDLFKQFGTLKEVRLVTYRNGHSKGLAYVDFEDEISAGAALVKTDGSKIGEHIISVAISNPPERKAKKNSSGSVTVSLSLGGGSLDFGPRGRGRTQVALLPRALQRSSATQQRPVKTDQSSVQNGNSDSPANSEGNKNLSNTDFRNMLLKK